MARIPANISSQMLRVSSFIPSGVINNNNLSAVGQGLKKLFKPQIEYSRFFETPDISNHQKRNVSSGSLFIGDGGDDGGDDEGPTPFCNTISTYDSPSVFQISRQEYIRYYNECSIDISCSGSSSETATRISGNRFSSVDTSFSGNILFNKNEGCSQTFNGFGPLTQRTTFEEPDAGGTGEGNIIYFLSMALGQDNNNYYVKFEFDIAFDGIMPFGISKNPPDDIDGFTNLGNVIVDGKTLPEQKYFVPSGPFGPPLNSPSEYSNYTSTASFDLSVTIT